MKTHAAFALMLICAIGTTCTTMPTPVDTTYLSEIKSDESARIQELEQEILRRKKDVDSARTERDIAVQDEALAGATKDFLERKMAVFREKEKLYNLTKDEPLAIKNKKAIRDLTGAISAHQNYLKYAAVRRDYLSAALELRETEMSAAVWEMQLEKARVARSYQDRRPEEFPEKKSGIAKFFKSKEKINTEDYENFLVKQKDLVKKAREKSEKIDREKAALEQYRTFKYEVE